LVGSTPLHLAIETQLVTTSELLLRFGANPDIPRKDGYTPLMMAVHRGSEPLVRLLLFYGSNPNSPHPIRWTPLHFCSKFNSLALAKILVEEGGGDVDFVSLDGCSPLHVACFHGSSPLTRYLIQRGVNEDWPNEKGKTALDLAKFNIISSD